MSSFIAWFERPKFCIASREGFSFSLLKCSILLNSAHQGKFSRFLPSERLSTATGIQNWLSLGYSITNHASPYKLTHDKAMSMGRKGGATARNAPEARATAASTTPGRNGSAEHASRPSQAHPAARSSGSQEECPSPPCPWPTPRPRCQGRKR